MILLEILEGLLLAVNPKNGKLALFFLVVLLAISATLFFI